MYLNTVPFVKHDIPYVIYLDAVLQRPFVYKAASIIFTFSECVRKFLIKVYKIDRRKIISVGAGPNLKRLPEVDKQYDGKTILFIGSEVVRKGGLILLKAFKKVKEKIPDARLIMISYGLKRDSKGEREKNLKKFDIFIKGYANKRILGSWYKKASVFVMPSIKEPFGIVFFRSHGL